VTIQRELALLKAAQADEMALTGSDLISHAFFLVQRTKHLSGSEHTTTTRQQAQTAMMTQSTTRTYESL